MALTHFVSSNQQKLQSYLSFALFSHTLIVYQYRWQLYLRMSPWHMAWEAQQLESFWKQCLELQPNVYRVIRNRVRHCADAEDLLQETMLEARQRLDSYNSQYTLASWLFLIATSNVLDHFRSRNRRPTVAFAEDEDVVFRDAQEELSPQEEALHECQAELPEKDRELIRMQYHAEMKPAEIASAIDKDPARVHRLIFEIRKKLAACIQGKLASAGVL
jgi:RNA polymerase sigma-70 factor, ECF subfamily